MTRINKVADYYKKSYYKASQGNETGRVLINQLKSVVGAGKHFRFYEMLKKHIIKILAGRFYWPSSWPTSLDPESGELLYGLVHLLKPEAVIEIGTFKGYGTICIGQALKENKKGKLYTIDPVEQQIVRVAIKKAKLKDYIEYIIDYSASAIPKLKLPKIDFAFIDGDHNYESVKSDFELLKPLIQKGGVVVFHDTILFDGPRKVIEEIKTKMDFEIITLPTIVGTDREGNVKLNIDNENGFRPVGLSICVKIK